MEEERRLYRAGDVVRAQVGNGRSEDWVLATDEYHGEVGCLGWPEGWITTKYVSLLEAASEEESLHQLERMACHVGSGDRGYDRRCPVARQQWLERFSQRPSNDLRVKNPFASFPSPPFENRAGKIQNLVEGSFSGVALIRSPAGAVRSNHWHRTDSHHLHVVSGLLLYWEYATEGGSCVGVAPGTPWLIRAGETFFTGPGVVHAIGFLEETSMVSVSALPRDNKSHEEDLVRVPFVGLEQLRRAAPWVDWKP